MLMKLDRTEMSMIRCEFTLLERKKSTELS